jgi:nitrogen-specific signal transduction histidine kinase
MSLCLWSSGMTDTDLLSADISNGAADAVLNALPLPVITVAADGKIANANVAAETFFEVSALLLRR